MTCISLEMTSYGYRKFGRSLLTFLKFSWIFVFFWFFWKFPKKWKPRVGWDTALLKLRIWVLERDSEPNTVNNSLKWLAFYSNWPHIDTESSWDHFWHLSHFPAFLCFSGFFWKFLKKWKPLIGWDTALLKLKICVLHRDSGPRSAFNIFKWPSFHSKSLYNERGGSGDHFWHFWNFAQFLCFSHFFGNSQNIEHPFMAQLHHF